MRRAIWVPLLAASLAACGSDAMRADSTFGQIVRGTTQPPTTLDPATLRAPLDCPRVSILPDTGSMRVTDRGTGGTGQPEGELRWLARIDETARECRRTETGVTARVGIAGRALAGPRGGPGVVRLPIRIAVREGEAVTYSKLHVINVDLGTAAGQDFAFVDDAVTLVDPETAQILVGFDEGSR